MVPCVHELVDGKSWSERLRFERLLNKSSSCKGSQGSDSEAFVVFAGPEINTSSGGVHKGILDDSILATIF